MRYDQKQFTQQGLNLFTNALSQKQSITIDKVIMDNLPTSNLSNLALLTLDDFANAQSFPANYTKVDNSMLTVDSVISNQGFTNSYSANEIGLVGHTESNNDETLIAILVASDPFILPAQQQDETPLHLIPNVTIQLANNDMGQVPVDTAQDAYVPQNRLDELVSQYNYVKLSDADNRYVKQSDFQNEVNNSVNEKADKSDLSNLQSNINNDVQPKLNQKANQSDLNTTNGSVSSLQSNKADKGDVNGQINQTLSQATAHSDQNLSTANNHSDSNYNDLSNKNNILSNDLKSNINTTNNLADKYSRSYYDAPNLSGTTNASYSGYGWSKVLDFPVEEGKEYWISAYSDEKDNWDLETVYDNSQSKMTNTNFFSRSFIADSTKKLPVVPYNDSGNGGNLYNICITQSDSYVPFEIAQRNKLWNDRITNKTNDLSNTMNQQFSQANSEIDQKADKTPQSEIKNGDDLDSLTQKTIYSLNEVDLSTLNANVGLPNGVVWGDVYVEPRANSVHQTLVTNVGEKYFRTTHNLWHHYADNNTVQSSLNSINENKADKNDMIDRVTFSNSLIGNLDNKKANRLDTDQQFNQSIAHTDQISNEKVDKPAHTVMQTTTDMNSVNYDVDMEINGISLGSNGGNWGAPGGIVWGMFYSRNQTNAAQQKIVTNLGETFIRTIGQKWHHIADQDDIYDKIARLSQSSWRELTVDGSNIINHHVLCKVNRNDNTATLSGTISLNSSGSTSMSNVTIYSSSDFSFNDSSAQITAITENTPDTHQVNGSGGNLTTDGDNYSSNSSLVFATSYGGDVIVPITPK